MRRDDVSDSFLYIREKPEEKCVESNLHALINCGVFIGCLDEDGVNKTSEKCVTSISRHIYRQPSAS